MVARTSWSAVGSEVAVLEGHYLTLEKVGEVGPWKTPTQSSERDHAVRCEMISTGSSRAS